MKINFSTELVGLDGDTLKDENGKAVALSVPCINALLATSQDDKVEPVEKMERFTIAQKISKAKKEEVEVSVEEVAKIKELVGKYMPILIMGSVWEALEK